MLRPERVMARPGFEGTPAVQRAGCVRLLPVPYFHVVYTLPSELRDIAYQNKRVGTVKLRRSSRNTGARGLSSCRGGRAVPLRPRRRRSTACSKPTPGPELSGAPRRRARSPRLRAASRPVAIPTGRSSLLTRRWREPDSNHRLRLRYSPWGSSLVVSADLPRFPPENEVRSGLSAGGGSRQRTRL